jgi:hypothetical protein
VGNDTNPELAGVRTIEETNAGFNFLFEKMDKGPSPLPKEGLLLAHYTSLPKFECILRSQEMWFSNPSNMNDWQEVWFGIEESVRAFSESADIRKACGNETRHDLLWKAVEANYMKLRFSDAANVYVLCLSEKQWMSENLNSFETLAATVARKRQRAFRDARSAQKNPESSLLLPGYTSSSIFIGEKSQTQASKGIFSLKCSKVPVKYRVQYLYCANFAYSFFNCLKPATREKSSGRMRGTATCHDAERRGRVWPELWCGVLAYFAESICLTFCYRSR